MSDKESQRKANAIEIIEKVQEQTHLLGEQREILRRALLMLCYEQGVSCSVSFEGRD